MDPKSKREESKSKQPNASPSPIQGNGRDELNIAEFPFTSLQFQQGAETKTLFFSDTIMGKDGLPIDRAWTVTGSDAFGLPVAGDVDIVIALMALTQEQGMRSREVFFTRYDLLRVMKWDNRGRSYARIKDGLDRLTGTTIKAERAFYDKQKAAYLNRAFHILDDYDLWDRAEAEGDARAHGALPLKSVVTWNRHIFKSLTSGYVKRLDTERFFRLKTPIAKQLFRYLDKKLYKHTAFQIELFKLCHEHLGISRACKHVSKLKERLAPAPQELVADGYLRGYDYVPSRSSRGGVIIHLMKNDGAERAPGLPSTAAYFYAQLHRGAETVRPISGHERALADTFVARHGLDVFREFVDFVMREKPSRWPNLATLTGAFQAFEQPFLTRMQERELRQEQAKQERRARESEQRIREAYAAYLSPLRQRMERQFPEIYASVERRTEDSLSGLRRFQEGDGPLAKSARELAERQRRETLERHFAIAFQGQGVLGFDAWRAAQGQGPLEPDSPSA